MGFKVILDKELRRVFKDRKMIFSLFMVPVLVMGLMFGIIFFLSQKQENKIESHASVVKVMNAPKTLEAILSSADNLSVSYISGDAEFEAEKEAVLNGDTDIILVFPKDFEQVISGGDKTAMPQVKTFYNPSLENSAEARNRIVANYLEQYRSSLIVDRFGSIEYAMVFSVDNDNPDMIIQDNAKASGKALGTIIPYIITIMLFAGAMGIGVDTIAGEKERGTMANLLISPVKRSHIIMGKIVGLGIVSVISAAVYVVSMIAAMVIGTKVMSSGNQMGLSSLVISFTATQIIQFAVLLLGVVWLYAGLIVIVSLLSKNMKEAQSYIMPLYMIVVAAGMVTIFGSGAGETSYLIPLYNTSIAFKGIFEGSISMQHYLTTVVITYLCSVLLVAVMTKIMKNEKIMLNA